MIKSISLLTALAAITGTLHAAPISFDFKDPKGVNTVVFQTDAPLESINGTANAISGTVIYDPVNPQAVKGKIMVAANSLHVGNPTMKEHLHGANWMDVSKFPEISFELQELANVKKEGDVVTADATGTMSMHGVTKTITVPVKFTYLKDKLKARSGKDGDLLVLRSKFSVKRSDFGLNPGKFDDKVSDEIELSFSLAGTAPKAS